MRDQPRTRGEHPNQVRSRDTSVGSAPHARGARKHHPYVVGFHGIASHARGARSELGASAPERGISPPRAGSTTGTPWPGRPPRDQPRMRRERLEYRALRDPAQGSAPHARGALERERRQGWRVGISPARAGSTAGGRGWCAGRRDQPRTRGEHVVQWWPELLAPGSAPHVRGARALPPRSVVDAGDQPRTCGEHDDGFLPFEDQTGSASHARGAQVRPLPPVAAAWDQPRTRGEHLRAQTAPHAMVGSAPHARGALELGPEDHLDHGISPARAGSTNVLPRVARRSRDQPRTREEHHSGQRGIVGWSGSAPHVRGALDVDHVAGPGVGISPARAGSTDETRDLACPRQDQPHTRGEHDVNAGASARSSGSAPHERGALQAQRPGGAGGGISPARAGSTGRAARGL
ncbi:hypothetical protein ABIA31_007962 [Catenulispora sp. MAP5-51]